MKVRKAVIPAAGFGTRFLPASKATPKELVAVVDRPAIQYVVEEAARSGIEDVLIITGRGKDAIADHFDRHWELENLLSEKGKLEVLETVREVADLAQVHTVRQAEALGLGHAIGVAERHVGDEPFMVLLPDDLVGERDTLTADMIAAYERYETSIVATMRVDGPEISLYGAAGVEPEPLEPGLFRMTDVIEKPDPDEAPSNLAVIGRYLFHPSIFEAIRATKPDHRGEIQITDAYKRLIETTGVLTLAFDGTRYDIGDKADFLRATVELAAGHPQLGQRFRAFLRDFTAGLDATYPRGPMTSRFPPETLNPPDLLPFEEAAASVLGRVEPLPPREVALPDALGCVLAEDVAAAEDLPPFANSAMDGFAVRHADLAGAAEDRPVELALAGEVFAGTAHLPEVTPGTCVRIMTGGPLPPGADAVVPVERTQLRGGSAVAFGFAPEPAMHVRDAGEDVAKGTVVLRAGQSLEPAAVGMLASVGRPAVQVHPRPRVAVVSTGDELVAPGEPLGPGQIRDSNSYMLVSQARAAGMDAFGAGHAADDPEALRRGFSDAAARADFVLTSGGVSVGEHDYTKQVLAELGDVRPWRVAMQPGMPQAFGLAAGTPLFGLPGNPVSCFVVFEVLVRPALRKLAGHPPDRLQRARVRARLAEPVRSPLGKTSFLRVTLERGESGLAARLTGAQGSGVLSSAVAADGLAVVPREHRTLPAGEEVEVVLLREHSIWES